MARGGKRPGAGRKKGAISKMTEEARAVAEATGELPHELLLRASRGEEISGHTPTFMERVDAAKAAAPYYQPRLASQEVLVNKGADPVRQDVEALKKRIRERNVRLGQAKVLPFERPKGRTKAA